MFGCNQDIVIWRRERDSNTKKESFTRVDVPVKCMRTIRRESHINGTGENLSDKTVVIIPYFEGVSETFIKLGDRIEFGIQNSESGINNAEKITVSAVEYNFTGRGRHVRVEGR